MKSTTWIAMGLTVSLWAGATRADEIDVKSHARFKEGVNFFKAGQWEQCRASFTQLLSLAPGNADVLLNLAICENDGGHYVEALGHLKEYLASPKSDPEETQRLKNTMHVKLWKATGHLKIIADNGETIALDGARLGSAPLADIVHVKPGNYRVTAGGRTEDVTVAAGEEKAVNLASPAQSLIPPPAEKQSSRSVEGWIVPGALGVLGVAGLGIGVGFAVSSSDAKNTERALRTMAERCVDANSAACGELKDARDRVSNRRTVSTIGYAVGGIAIVGAVATWFLWPQSKQDKTGVAVNPVVGSGSAGLHFSGNF